jgi:protein gp37
MADGTKIEWATHTWSPWTGCTKVSAACDHCYAEAWAKRSGHPELWQGERRRTSATYWQRPIRWEREAILSGQRPRIFPSLCDPFDNQVPERWRDDFWHCIEQTPHLDWLLLTKRPQNIAKMLPDPRTGTGLWGEGWPNVWLGTTTENQEEFDRRWPHLRNVAAAIHFLCMEPLLGPIFFRPDKPDWIIVGGESGGSARPMHPDWARDIRDQCHAQGTPFHFKQWGAWEPQRAAGLYRGVERIDFTDGVCMLRVGKHAAGRLLDGREHSEFPA